MARIADLTAIELSRITAVVDRYFWTFVSPRDLPRRTGMLAGASMHAPAALPRWIEELPRHRPIVVYCICGFQVSGSAVTELRRRGYDARALVGGITAWHAIGGATVPLDMSTYEEAP